MKIRLFGGGQGSGNFRHKGRPGYVGGSGQGDQDAIFKEWYLNWETNPIQDDVRNLDRQFEKRGFQKNEIVTELSRRSGIEYSVVNEFIREWTNIGSSGVYAIHLDAAQEFGFDANDFIKSRANPSFDSDTSRRILRAMYEYTQETLPDFDTVTLYRAIGTRKIGMPGDRLRMNINPLSSWAFTKEALDYFVSRNYGRDMVLVKAEIPRSQILGTARTGFGALHEYEIIVLSQPNIDVEVIK